MKHKKILHWDDERSYGNGFMITTAYGWAFDPDPDENVASHVRGFDTAKDARSKLKWIKQCHCARCTRKEGG
jgi:hypothetical protein